MKNLWFVTTDDASDVELDSMFGEIFTSVEKAENYALQEQREHGNQEYFIYEMHYVEKTFTPRPVLIKAEEELSFY